MSDNGTGMETPPNSEPSGAVTSQDVGRKKPSQAKLRSGFPNQKSPVKIDRNRHGIRRETSVGQKKTRPKKT